MGSTATRCNTHCNTLQHTTPHCISLQHTAILCHALQHTAPHCNALPRTGFTGSCAAPNSHRDSNTLHHTTTFCNTQGLQVRGRRQIQGRVDVCHHNTLQPTATYCVTLQHNATHCNPLQHTATHRVYKFVGGAKFKGEWKYGKMDGYGVYENLGIYI